MEPALVSGTLRAILFIAGIAFSSLDAIALPLLGSSEAIGLSSQNENGRIVIEDHADPRIRYLPYDEIKIGKEQSTGRPAFRFQYNDDGGIMTAMASAGYSAAARSLRNELIASGFDVRPLPISTGSWVLTVFANDHRQVIATPATATILPEIPHAVAITVSREALAFLTEAFRTGASVGINYVYSFRTAAEPRTIRARMNLVDVQSRFRDELQKRSSFCTTRGFISHSPFCYSTFEDVRSLVKTALQQREIRVVTLGDVSSQDRLRHVDDLARLVSAKLLLPQPRPLQEGAPSSVRPLPQRCTNMAASTRFDAACSSEEVFFVYDFNARVLQQETIYEVSSQDLLVSQGAVGSSFSYMCQAHPDAITYVRRDGSSIHGCPIKQTVNGFITTETNATPTGRTL